MILTVGAVNKDIKSKRKFSTAKVSCYLQSSGILDNHFHNILRLFDVLPNFLFTTSEAICDYYL